VIIYQTTNQRPILYRIDKVVMMKKCQVKERSLVRLDLQKMTCERFWSFVAEVHAWFLCATVSCLIYKPCVSFCFLHCKRHMKTRSGRLWINISSCFTFLQTKTSSISTHGIMTGSIHFCVNEDQNGFLPFLLWLYIFCIYFMHKLTPLLSVANDASLACEVQL